MGCKELRGVVNEGLIKVYQVNDQQFVNKAYGILHKGELEVVVAALENNIKNAFCLACLCWSTGKAG